MAGKAGASHVNSFGKNEFKVFVGALPVDASDRDVRAILNKWDGVVDIYYPGPPKGWATAEFSSRRKRDAVVRDKHKYNKMFGKVVDVKEYVWIPKDQRDTKAPSTKKAEAAAARAKATNAQQHNNNNNNQSWNPPSSVFGGGGGGPVRRPSPAVSPARVVMAPSATGLDGTPGMVCGYVDGMEHLMGVLRTAQQDRVVFHLEATFYCIVHRLQCTTDGCPTYGRLRRPLQAGRTLRDYLPVGTMVNFYQRTLDEFPLVPFDVQATDLWPTASLRPHKSLLCPQDLYDIQMIDYMELASNPVPATYSPPPAIRQQYDYLEEQRHRQPQQQLQQVLPPLPQYNSTSLSNHGSRAGSVTNFNHSGAALMQSLGFGSQPSPAPTPPPASNASVGGGATASETSDGGSSSAPNAVNDLDNYIDILNQLRNFLEESFRSAGVPEPESLYLLPLARKVLKNLGSKKALPDGGSSLLAINSFVKDNGLALEASKKRQMMTHFKVYHKTLAYQVQKEIADLEAVNNTSLASVAQKIGVVVQEKKSKQGEKGAANINVAGGGSLGSLGGNFRNGGSPPTSHSQEEEHFGTEIGQEATTQPPPPPTTVLDAQLDCKDGGADGCPVPIDGGLFEFVAVDIASVKTFDGAASRGKIFDKIRALDSVKTSASSDLASLVACLDDFQANNYNNFVYKPEKQAGGGSLSDLTAAVVHTWADNGKSGSFLVKYSGELPYRPALLLGHWAGMAEKTWASHNSCEPSVACDSLVKATYAYCWPELASAHKRRSKADKQALKEFNQILMGVHFKSMNGNLYNCRGVVVHLFNDYFGVAFTADGGPVLFERNVVYVGSGGVGPGQWSRCTSTKKIAPGSFVKLHASLGRTRTKRNKIEYLFATKVWLATPEAAGMDDPAVGPEVPGGKVYWKEVLQEFEGIVKANPQLARTEDDDGAIGAKYGEVVTHFLEKRFVVNNTFNNSKARKDDGGGEQGWLSDYKPFLDHVANRDSFDDGFERKDLVAMLGVLRGAWINLAHLRGRYVTSRLLQSDDTFFELVESVLLTASVSLFSSKRAKSAVAVNVTPFLFDYFERADPAAAEQLEEAMKLVASEGDAPFSVRLISELCGVGGFSDSDEGGDEEEMDDEEVEVVNGEDVGTGSEEEEDEEDEDQDDEDDGEHEHEEEEAVEKEEVGRAASDGGGDDHEDTSAPSRRVLKAELDAMSAALERMSRSCESLGDRVDAIEAFRRKTEDEALLAEDIAQLRKVSKELRAFREGKVTAVPAASGTNGIKSWWPERKSVVKVRSPSVQPGQSADGETYEFATRDDGELLFDSVKAVFPRVNALKYSLDGAIRVCNRIGDIFDSPEGGWGGRIYTANESFGVAAVPATTATGPAAPFPAMTSAAVAPTAAANRAVATTSAPLLRQVPAAPSPFMNGAPVFATAAIPSAAAAAMIAANLQPSPFQFGGPR